MRAPSHQYQFTVADVLRIFSLPLLPLLVFALGMHLGAKSRILPLPQPALDIDRTILLHQAQASRENHSTGVILLGDSSCLMDVATDSLDRALSKSGGALNLGTLSYLDLAGYSRILQTYLASNSIPPRAIVLLMHPEALRRGSPEDYYTETLNRFYEGQDYCPPSSSAFLCATGAEIFRGRFLSRALPQPLPGAFGRHYGFTHDLWRYLSAHRGSATDPGLFDPQTATGNAEYRLAPSLEAASKSFRRALPRGTKLIVGITPTPESFVPESYTQTRLQLLKRWSEWLQAESVLEALPATLPDRQFASITHLNAAGAAVFTDALAKVLSPHLSP